MVTYRDMFYHIIDGNFSEIKGGLDDGFDLNKTDQYGFLLIHRACANHQPEIVSLLIERGSKLQERATDKWTPLHIAAVSGSIDCIPLLVNAGANPNVQDKNGQTPLHLSIISRNPKITKELIDLGSHKDIKNSKGQTPLEYAINKGAIEFYEALS